jgi:hypothetical protein
MYDNIYTLIAQDISVEESGASDGVVWADTSTGRLMLGDLADLISPARPQTGARRRQAVSTWATPKVQP